LTCKPSALCLLTLLPAASLRANDIYWTNAAGGNWNVAANWSPNGVPGSADNAYIISNGTYTVVQNVTVSVNNLVLGGSTGVQTLSDSTSDLTVRSNTIVNANGVVAFGGGTLKGLTSVAGLFNLTGGYVDGKLTIATNGTMNISGAATKTFWY